MMRESLAEKLRILRAREGLSLSDAAERAGVTRDTLSELERGKRHPYTPTLHKIARGYGVPVEDLLEELAVAGKAEAPPAAEQLSVPSGTKADEGRRILSLDHLARRVRQYRREIEALTGVEQPAKEVNDLASRADGVWELAYMLWEDADPDRRDPELTAALEDLLYSTDALVRTAAEREEDEKARAELIDLREHLQRRRGA